MSRIERGVVPPTVPRLAELASIFECNVADLLTEASPRASDQASHLVQLLEPLDEADRTLIIEMIEKLTLRLGRA